MTPIGGYFELELRGGGNYHPGALRLNSARSCMEYLLRVRGYRKVYLPYYTCEIMVQPFRLLHVDYAFYHLNAQLEPENLPLLKEGEAFLYTNYFGLKQPCVERLAQHYGNSLIVDNAQAFFAPALPGIDTFYSPRKFLGVPDGGYLYCDTLLDEELPQALSHDRMSHLLIRADIGAEAGYADYQRNDENLGRQPVMRMSALTEKILESIDYQSIIKARKTNYRLLDNALRQHNRLQVPCPEEAVPMVYPYLTEDPGLKGRLISRKIFVATYWPNVLDWCAEGDWEHLLARQGCFLPVDQRYGEGEMMRILNDLQN